MEGNLQLALICVGAALSIGLAGLGAGIGIGLVGQGATTAWPVILKCSRN